MFGTAAMITAARTGGETWLMPVFVFPTLSLVVASVIVAAAVALRGRLVARWIPIVLIVAACLLLLYQPQTPGNFIPVLVGAVLVALGIDLVVFGGRPSTSVGTGPPDGTVAD